MFHKLVRNRSKLYPGGFFYKIEYRGRNGEKKYIFKIMLYQKHGPFFTCFDQDGEWSYIDGEKPPDVAAGEVHVAAENNIKKLMRIREEKIYMKKAMKKEHNKIFGYLKRL